MFSVSLFYYYIIYRYFKEKTAYFYRFLVKILSCNVFFSLFLILEIELEVFKHDRSSRSWAFSGLCQAIFDWTLAYKQLEISRQIR